LRQFAIRPSEFVIPCPSLPPSAQRTPHNNAAFNPNSEIKFTTGANRENGHGPLDWAGVEWHVSGRIGFLFLPSPYSQLPPVKAVSDFVLNPIRFGEKFLWRIVIFVWTVGRQASNRFWQIFPSLFRLGR
jgi:hypothetical protein